MVYFLLWNFDAYRKQTERQSVTSCCFSEFICNLKKMNFIRYSGDSEGATATVTAAIRPNNDQRQPRKITVENFSNQQNDDNGAGAAKSLLPSFGSRETTPATATADDVKAIEEKGFIYGNPFVEVTKGIIHIYKKK